VRQLPCHEIADEIEHNLSFLATSQKNVPARHRSLEAAFEHSWALLAADERRAFARLAVFRGGCEREAAVAVGQCALAVLAALGDKSLVRRAPNGRLAIHELLRQYAEASCRPTRRPGPRRRSSTPPTIWGGWRRWRRRRTMRARSRRARR